MPSPRRRRRHLAARRRRPTSAPTRTWRDSLLGKHSQQISKLCSAIGGEQVDRGLAGIVNERVVRARGDQLPHDVDAAALGGSVERRRAAVGRRIEVGVCSDQDSDDAGVALRACAVEGRAAVRCPVLVGAAVEQRADAVDAAALRSDI